MASSASSGELLSHYQWPSTDLLPKQDAAAGYQTVASEAATAELTLTKDAAISSVVLGLVPARVPYAPTRRGRPKCSARLTASVAP